MLHGLRRHLLLGLTLAIAIGLIAIFSAVHQSARSHIEVQARAELNLAARVFEQLLTDRREQLTSHVRLLAENQPLRNSIAAPALAHSDRAILDRLVQHQESIGADLAVLVDDRTGGTTGTAPGKVAPELLSRLRAREPHRTNTLTVLGGKPCQLAFAPIRTSSGLFWLGLGYRVDKDLVQRLNRLTNIRASVLFRDPNGTMNVVSTLPDSLTASLPNSGGSLPNQAAGFVRALEGNRWLSSTYPLLDASREQLLLLLSTSIADDLAALDSLRRQLVIVGLLVLVLAGSIALWFAARSSRRIRALALAAHRITHGDYSTAIGLADKQLQSLESAFNRMQRALQQREARFSFQARHDQLTGVANRHHFERWLRSRLSDTHPPEPCALVLMQISGLNQLNDIYGPEVAGHLVKASADRAGALLGPKDRIARFESDQFFLYLDGLRENDLELLKDRLLAVFKPPFALRNTELKLDIRFGVALCPQHGTNYSDLLRRSNIALSQTFSNKTLFEVYESGQDAVHLRKVQIIHALQDAAEKKEFELLLQPQFGLASRSVVRAEALIRWRKRDLGVVSPDEFIPLAERSGHIAGISHWLVEEAVQHLSRWQGQHSGLGLSINVSAPDLLRDSFIDYLIERVAEAGIQYSLLVLEVTEGAMIEQPERAIENLQRLHQLGFTIAMDDFGTGFSSLSQLKALPISELKIDKSFILALDRDTDDQTIVRAAIHMAHSLGLQVVAEGVENQPTFAALQSMNCDIIQGNYLAQPMAVKQFEQWFENFDPQSLVTGEEPVKTEGRGQ